MDIAIIGMAGRFPDAKDINGFYRNLRDGKDVVRKFSVKRLRNTSLPERQEYELFGYLEDIELFDNDFFNISPGEAEQMDPHQRMIMEVVYETFENAGYNPDDFNGSNTSIFAGDINLAYQKHAKKSNAVLTVGNLNSITTGRIARYFNLRGSALMVDSACSSSLVALHYACRELASKDADHALVCGMNLKLFPDLKSGGTDEMGISSPEGKTKSFSASANGTGSGEAICCVLLKPLEQAIKDNDIIHAVIKGSAVNQDAALSGSLTAPSSQAQSEVIRKAWQNAGINPTDITYIEAHGTATRLGDPIEVQGISQAFAGFNFTKQFCAIGALKSNIGHTAGAAGLSSLIKTVLSIKYKQLFQSLHFDKPNPFIDFENSPVYVCAGLKDWIVPEDKTRIAGVSSFGFSGTNCHVVVAEGPASVRQQLNTDNGGPYLILLSGNTPASLKANMEALRLHLIHNPGDKLNDIAYTLQAGRKHFPFRFAAIVHNRKGLTDLLKKEWLNKTTYTASGREPQKIIFTFLDDAETDPALIKSLYDKQEAFRKNFDVCLQQAGENSRHPGVQQLAFQYSFFMLLQNLHSKNNILLGEGIGDITIKVLTGKLSLKEATEHAASFQRTQTANRLQRCQSLLQAFSKEPVAFLEMGIAGQTVHMLKELAAPAVKHRFIFLGNDYQTALAGYAGDLYTAGLVSAGIPLVGTAGRRIELPAYQFDRKRCWINELGKKEYADWLYTYSWQAAAAAQVPVTPDGSKNFLLFSDDRGWANELATQLEKQGHTCILVQDGNEFSAAGKNNFTIRSNEQQDYTMLYTALTKDAVDIAEIIDMRYCGLSAAAGHLQNETFTEALLAQLKMAAAFDEWLTTGHRTITLISFCARKITGNEPAYNPEQTCSHGFLTSLQEDEKLTLEACCIDIDEETAVQHMPLLAREIITKALPLHSAFRAGKKYVPLLEKKEQEKMSIADAATSRRETYIITGGISGIKIEFCRHLARKNVHLILIDDQSISEKQEWGAVLDDPAHPDYEIVYALTEMEQSGTTVHYYCTDISSPEQLRETFLAATKITGKPGYIYHLNAIMPANPEYSNNTGNMFREYLQPLVKGAVNITSLAAQAKADLFFFTSYAGIMGHKGNICFAAASFFIDEISRGNTVPGTRITEVKWPGWSATGLASDGETTQGISAIRIMTTDALEMADLILQTGAGHLVVSENNLELLEANPYFSTNNKKTPPVPGAAATIAVDAETAVEMKSVAAELPGLTATERRIYQVWKDVLKLDTIGVNDDFFEIGGHSLNGGQIINKIAKEFNVEIDFEVLFDYSTISTLALYIEELQGIGDSAEEDNKLVAVSSSEHYAVSPAQKRLWILQQLDRRSSAYNMSASYEFDGALDVPAFLKAYTLLIKRHESLRTTFITAEGEPRQKINTFTELQFGLRYDESLLNDADNEARLLQMILEDAQKPFDLEKGPLIRGTLVRSQESRYIFFFSVHHIIGDGWSLNVIQQEMKMLYDACVKGIEAPLVPLKLHYKDFTAWHTAHLGDESVQEAAQYWRQQFSGVVPAVRLPLSFPRPVNKSYAAKRLTLQLNQDISLMVKEFSKKNEATSFMTVLSLVKILLFTCTGQDDLVIGTPVSGRNHEELENQVGLYLNTLAIRTKFKKEDSCTQLAERVKENTIRALKYQAYPFDRLLEDLDIIPPAGRNPLFDIGFTYNSFTGVNVPAATAEEDSFDTIAISRLDHGNATVKGDLWFLVYDGYDSLKINLDYNTALFSENFAAGFMEDFKFIIHTVLEKPALPLAGISELVAENNQRIQQEKQNKLRKKNSNALKERFRK